jgi:hypothetical protein
VVCRTDARNNWSQRAVPEGRAIASQPLRVALDKAFRVLLDEKAAAPLIAMDDGHIDGDHHKARMIDLMVPALTGCLKVEVAAKECNDQPYTHKTFGENNFCAGTAL